MLPIPGVGDPVRGSVRGTDDGRGNFLPGAAEETGAVQEVWGGDGGWIYGRTHEDTTWATGRGDMELYNLGNGVRTADIPHGLSWPRGGRGASLLRDVWD